VVPAQMKGGPRKKKNQCLIWRTNRVTRRAGCYNGRGKINLGKEGLKNTNSLIDHWKKKRTTNSKKRKITIGGAWTDAGRVVPYGVKPALGEAGGTTFKKKKQSTKLNRKKNPNKKKKGGKQKAKDVQRPASQQMRGRTISEAPPGEEPGNPQPAPAKSTKTRPNKGPRGITRMGRGTKLTNDNATGPKNAKKTRGLSRHTIKKPKIQRNTKAHVLATQTGGNVTRPRGIWYRSEPGGRVELF